MLGKKHYIMIYCVTSQRISLALQTVLLQFAKNTNKQPLQAFNLYKTTALISNLPILIFLHFSK